MMRFGPSSLSGIKKFGMGRPVTLMSGQSQTDGCSGVALIPYVISPGRLFPGPSEPSYRRWHQNAFLQIDYNCWCSECVGDVSAVWQGLLE